MMQGDGEFPYKHVIQFFNLMCLGFSCAILAFNLKKGPEDGQIISLNIWYIIGVFIFQGINVVYYFNKPMFRTWCWLRVLVKIGAYLTFLILGWNLYLMYKCLKDGSTPAYIKLLAYIYELATITGPVALYGLTLLLLLC
jgi:hypothetical protein